MLALGAGHLEFARLLLSRGAQVNLKAGMEGATALTVAVRAQDSAAVRLLLENGADATVRTREGKGLLTLLKETDPTDRFGIAPLLKQAGAKE